MAPNKKKDEPQPTTVVEKSTPLSSELVAGLEGLGGQGFENQTREDLTIPVIKLLQGLNPEVKDGRGKIGQLFNSVTEEVSDELLFVPAISAHEMVEFVPRSAGGGFVATHALNSDAVKWAKANCPFGAWRVPKGQGKVDNELVEFFSYFGVICDDLVPTGMAVFRFSGTKIKVYKQFNTRLQTFQLEGAKGRRFTPPMFSHLVLVTTRDEKNNKGEYSNLVLRGAVDNDLGKGLMGADDPRLQMAVECRRLVMEGAVTAGYDEPATREPGEDDVDDECGF